MNINEKLNQFGNFLVAPVEDLKKSVKGTLTKSPLTTQKVASLALSTFLMISTLSLSYFLGKMLLSKAVSNPKNASIPSSISLPKYTDKKEEPIKASAPPTTGGTSTANSKPATIETAPSSKPVTAIPLPLTGGASTADPKPVATAAIQAPSTLSASASSSLSDADFEQVINLKNRMLEDLYQIVGSHTAKQNKIYEFQASLEKLETKGEKKKELWIGIITGKKGINEWLKSTYPLMSKDKYPTVNLLAYLDQKQVIRPYKKELSAEETACLKSFIVETTKALTYIRELELKKDGRLTVGLIEALNDYQTYLNSLKSKKIFKEEDIKVLFETAGDFSIKTGLIAPEYLLKIKGLLSSTDR